MTVLGAAAGVRPRLGRRLQVHHRGPQRRGRSEEAGKGRREQRPRRRPRRTARVAKRCSPSSGPTRRSCTSTSTATSARRWASIRSDVSPRCRSTSARFYVNDFNQFGRTWQVVVQAEGPFRDDLDKVKLLKVRNASGDMVPLGAVLTVREIGGPINMLARYNMYPAAAILGRHRARACRPARASRRWSGSADQTLPPGMAYEWTEINYMQIDAAKNVWNNLIFPLAVVFVFLVLAAQYESWALPLAVILVVPMCILGSLDRRVRRPHGDINIFTQIGFVVLVGLASKNAILIVEFAKHKREARPVAARGDAGGVPAAAAADPDDLVRLHPRRGAADGRRRRRGRDAADAGHGRVQRHAGRDAVRHLPDAGVLLRHRRVRRDAALPRGADAPRRPDSALHRRHFDSRHPLAGGVAAGAD